MTITDNSIILQPIDSFSDALIAMGVSVEDATEIVEKTTANAIEMTQELIESLCEMGTIESKPQETT